VQTEAAGTGRQEGMQRAALGEECPACAAAAEVGRNTLRELAAVRPATPPALCPCHGEQLCELDDPELDGWLEQLVRGEVERWASGTAAADWRERCQACEAGVRAAEAVLAQIAGALEDEAVRRAYAGGPGFCRTHLRAALARATRPVREWLLADTRRRLRDLAAELDRYSQRFNNRNRERPEPAQAAWRRALVYFWPAPLAPRTERKPDGPCA
jgi:hypothetical protein